MAQKLSMKHLMIDKANTTIVGVLAATAFVAIFSIVASYMLFGQAKYQDHLISAKKQTLNQIKQNITATQSLISSYKAFVSTPQNLIGGNPSGSGNRDGDNAKIVLDALPPQYDFPALATSLQQILTSQNVTITGIGGTDEQLSQQQNQSSADPTPVIMPFQISVQGDYQGVQNVINAFEHSIRPFQFQTMQLTGSQSSLSLTLSAQTFYQPEKDLTITTRIVK